MHPCYTACQGSSHTQYPCPTPLHLYDHHLAPITLVHQHLLLRAEQSLGIPIDPSYNLLYSYNKEYYHTPSLCSLLRSKIQWATEHITTLPSEAVKLWTRLVSSSQLSEPAPRMRITRSRIVGHIQRSAQPVLYQALIQDFGQGASRVLTPRGCPDPKKLLKIEGFPLKLPKCMILK